MSSRIIALDLETTGLNPRTDQILEIGAVRVEAGEIRDTFSTFIQVRGPISPFITNLTGITDEMAASGRPLKQAMAEFLDFAGEEAILGHNVLFDYGFLKTNALRLGCGFERDGIDTLGIAKKFLPELPSRSLGALCAHYAISQEKQHRAFEDALSAYRLYEHLKSEFENASPAAFLPKQLCFQVKKESPATAAQKRYLNDLIKYHKIETVVSPEDMTRGEASRTIDGILANYGRIKR